MSRQETNNTFSDGLIKDLNPINTPNTALTDCVNGTIITYDGNEYSLQNDKGNYGLENCKLHPNYIPVGLKEYGDILYIVSYNPLDEHVEIGSYPSPETITGPHNSNSLSSGDIVTNIYSKLLQSGETKFSYQEVIKEYSKLYVFYGEDPDKNKMHEGDLIKLEVNDKSSNPFERLQYVLISDNRQVTDISDKIAPYIGSNEYKPISWGPGWFGFKPVIAEISDNIINIKKIKIPTYNSGFVNLKFNTRISTSDSLLINLSEDNLSKLKMKVKLTGKTSTGDEPIWEDELELNNPLDLKNGDFYYYSDDISISDKIDITKYTSVTLTTIPLLYLDNRIYIKYDHLERSSIFNLSSKGDPKNFLLGEVCWYWKTDSTNNNLSICFDTVGLSQASVLDVDVFLKYSIAGLDDTPIVDSNGDPYTNKLYSGWNIIGDSTIELDTEPFTRENYLANPNKLYTENIYKIKFSITDESDNIIKEFGPKTIVASELLNSLKTLRYDTVSIDEWLNNYVNSIKEATFNTTSSKNGSWVISRSNPQVYNTWRNPKKKFKSPDITYSTFLSDLEVEEVNKNDAITWTAKCNFSTECTSDIKLLVGPMWINFNRECKVQFNNNTINFDEYTGKLIGSSTIVSEGSSTKSIPCSLTPISQNNKIWSYEETTPTYRELKLSITGYHTMENGNITNHTSKRKWLKLIFTLKSSIDTLWSKTWSHMWWERDNTKSSYNNEPSVTASNILDALKKDDLGLVDISVGTITNDRNDYCGIGLRKTTDSGEENIITNDGNGGWDFNSAHTQFLVIKLDNDALFVEIPNTYWDNNTSSKESNGINAVTNFCSEIKRIKTLDSFSTNGGFWRMDLGDTVINNATLTPIKGELLFPNSLIIGSFDLLNKSNIPEGLSLSSNDYLFESVVLESNNNPINETIDFTSTNEDETTLRNAINKHNNTVENEVSSYIGNVRYAAGFNSGTWYELDGTSFANRGVLVNYMNEKIHRPNTILYGWDKYNNFGLSGMVERRIGKISKETLS